MSRRTRILGGSRGHLLRKVGREALVEEHDRHVESLAQRLREPLARARLLAAVAAERQRMPDDDRLDILVHDESLELGETVVARRSPDDAERTRDQPGGVGHCDAGAGGTEVEGHHLHAARAFRAASSASATPSGFFPPASASVGLPPPPPPMWRPRSRTNCEASRPCWTSDSSKLTTRKARPSSTEATIAPSAFSCWRSRSERSRSGPPLIPRALTSSTLPSFATTSWSISCCADG